MPIEESLERIASALEALVKYKAGVDQVSDDSSKKSEPLETGSLTKAGTAAGAKPEAARTRPGKKVEEKVETVEEDFLPDETAQETTDLEIKWPDVNKKLFGMLNRVRDEIGPDEAKAICASLMKKYSGGQKFGPGTVAPKSYKALLEEIEIELEALGG